MIIALLSLHLCYWATLQCTAVQCRTLITIDSQLNCEYAQRKELTRLFCYAVCQDVKMYKSQMLLAVLYTYF